MTRCGGSIYVNTDPTNVVQIGIPGNGVSLGPMGTNIYNANPYLAPVDGSTVQIAPSLVSQEILYNVDGTTTFAALTFNFAAAWGAGVVTQSSQKIRIQFQQTVTALTFTGGPFDGAALPTTILAGGFVRFTWDGAAWTYFP